MQNKKLVIRFRRTYQKINDNIAYSFFCTGNEMSENYLVNVVQMEKALASCPNPGSQSISTKPQECWDGKKGNQTSLNGCTPGKLFDPVVLLPPDDLLWVDALVMKSHSPVCWRHIKGYLWKAAFWKLDGPSHRCSYREDKVNWSRMKHPVCLTNVPTKCLYFALLAGTQACGGCLCFLPNGG